MEITFGPDGPRCARHPDRPAVRPCARCGTFICPGCVVSEELCPECKAHFLRRGEPYSPQEHARAAARRARARSARLLRTAVVACALGAVVVVMASRGSVPLAMRPVGLGLFALAGGGGLLAAGLAVFGYVRSEQGRPGPAVPGVFSLPAAAATAAVGVAPAVALLVAWFAP